MNRGEETFWWLDPLLEHEARYYAFAASTVRTDYAWYLFSETLPHYFDVNRALRLRSHGQEVSIVLSAVLEALRAYNRRPLVLDIDPLAEREGFAGALLRLRAQPNTRAYPLYAYTLTTPPRPAPSSPSITVQVVPEEDHEAREQWAQLQVSEETPKEEHDLWEAVARLEASSTLCKLYLAYVEGVPVGACDLFSYAGWGRVDSVITHPAWRRRGVASALVAHVVGDSLAMGNHFTYLFAEEASPAERVYRRLGFRQVHPRPLHRFLLFE